MQKTKIYLLKNLEYYLLFILILLFGSIYAYISVANHNHFQTFGWDLGYFDQLIWKISKGIYPLSSLSKVNILAGHFAPILFLFAPFYWIWPDPRVLLVIQAYLMVIPGIFLYLLAKKKIKNPLVCFSIVFSYLLFTGTQWSILNEFHEATIAPLFIVMIFYGLEYKKKFLFWISIIGLLTVKEEMALLVCAIGVTLFFHYKQRRTGLLIFIFSFLFFFFLTNIFMPFVSETKTFYHPHLSDSAKTPSDLFLKILTDPLFAFRNLVTPIGKINTLFFSLLSFGFLPLFAPFAILIPLTEQFFMRFLYTGPQFTVWQNTNHHGAPAAILLAIVTVYAISKIRKKKLQLLTALILFCCVVFQDVYLKAPVHSIFKKQLYEQQAWMKDVYQVLEKTPKDLPLSAQNSIFPHVSGRKDIYLFPEIENSRYIILDLNDGPNKFSPLTQSETKEKMDNLLKNGDFKLEYQVNNVFLLRRN